MRSVSLTYCLLLPALPVLSLPEAQMALLSSLCTQAGQLAWEREKGVCSKLIAFSAISNNKALLLPVELFAC